MNAIGYARCSTVEQVDSGLGLEVQHVRIKAYCTLKNLVLTEIITDEGISGGKPLASRPGGKRLLLQIKKRRSKAVVMLKLDRMFRNAGDCLSTVEQWDKSDIGLHVIDLGGNAIDTTSAAGRFMLVVLAGAAEMERNLISERTKSAMAIIRANGKRVGSVPYGHDLASDGCTLIPNPSEKIVIAKILDLRQGGMTLQAIANLLTSDGVPAKNGGCRWPHQTIANIVRRCSSQH